jgi:hypothetical protein
MTSLPFSIRLFLFTLSFALSFALTTAQTTTEAAATDSKADILRLQALETTYQTNLRKLHGPILLDYLRELEQLKQRLTVKDRLIEAKQADTEISRVKQLVATTGALEPLPPRKEPPPPELAGPADKNRRPPPRPPQDAIVLSAEDAKVSSGLGTTLVKDSPTKAVLLGTATWKVPTVTAGTYDLVAVYSCAKLEPPRSVTVRFAGNEVKRPLSNNQITATEDTFRILRIGQITLDKEVSNEELTIELDQPDKPVLWVRSLAISKPKPKPDNK